MKRKIIIILVALLTLTLALGIFVACDPEASTEYTLTFNANGVGDNVTISGKSGDDIAQQLPAFADTNEWYFGGWYDNESFAGNAITLPTAMPKGNATYYARWYVTYKVQVYVENLSEGFELDEELSYSVNLDKGNVPATVDVQMDPMPKGMHQIGSEADRLLKIEGRDSEIAIKLQRARHDVIYHVNADAKLDNGDNVAEDVTVHSVFGATISLNANMFDTEQFAKLGYRFAGYSLKANGNELLAQDANLVVDDEDLHIYAIWDEAYVDRNGGGDMIYIPRHETDVAYLVRMGIGEKKGAYNASSQIFSFVTGDADFTYTGKVYEDHTFVANRGMDTYPYYFYDVNEDILYDDVYVEFDAYDTATLHITAAASGKIATWYNDGALQRVALPAGDHTATYKYDDMYGGLVLTVKMTRDSDNKAINANVNFYILPVIATEEDGETFDAFIVQGIEAGYYAENIDEEGNIEGNSLILDGYGNAVYVSANGYLYAGSYVFDGNLSKVYVTLDIGYFSAMISDFVKTVESGINMGYLMMYDNRQATYEYYDDYYDDYTYEATVTFSGYGYAMYTTGDKTVTYNYEFIDEALLGGTNIAFVRLYTLDTHELVYTLVIDSDYSSFLIVPNTGYVRTLTDFANAMSIMVFDGEGNVFMYEYDAYYGAYSYVYEIGTVQKIDDNLYSVSFSEDSFNFFELETNGIVTAYYEGTQVYNATFKGANGSEIYLDGWGNAVYYEANGRYHIGRYFNLDSLAFQCEDDYCYVMFYFTVDAEKGTFTIEEDQSEAEGEFAYYDGRSLNEQIVLVIDELGNAVIKVDSVEAVKGTVTFADYANFYLLFTVTEVVDASTIPSALTVNFLFIQGSYDSNLVFKLSDGYEGEYSVTNGMVLTLDGFGYGSIAQDGKAVGGAYLIYTDSDLGTHVVAFISDNGYGYYFDMWSNGSVTLRGGEFSLEGYVLTDLNGIYPFFIFPDGYGNIEIIFYDTTTSTLYTMAVGKYTFINGYGAAYDVIYTYWVEDEDSHTSQEEADYLNNIATYMRIIYRLDEEFEFQLVSMSGYDCFVLYNESWNTVFQLDDWSAIVTDGYLSAYYVNRYGDVYEGQYIVESYEDYFGFDVIRFYSNYGRVYTFMIVGTRAELIGNEFGNYTLYDAEDDNAPELFLDGLGYVLFYDGEDVLEGYYIYDEYSGIVTAMLFLDDEDYVIMIFRIDTYYMDFMIYDDELAGEYVNVNDTGCVLTLDGFDGAVLNDNGTITYYYIEHYMGDVYMLIDLDTYIVTLVKLNLEEKTFVLSDDKNAIENAPLFNVLTGELDYDNTISVDGFGIVTMNEQVIGTLIEKTSDSSMFAYIRLVYYTVQTSEGEFKFATYLTYLDLNTVVYVPYNATYDVTLTRNDGSEPIKLNGYGLALLAKDSYERNMYYFNGEKLVIRGIYGGDPAVYNVDWISNYYTEDTDIDESLFVIEGDKLVEFLGTANNGKLEVTIPDRVKEIADGVFKGKGLTSIDLNNVEKIGKESLAGASLTTGTLVSVIAPHLKVIGESAFQYAQITSIDLPAVVTIGVKAFYGVQTLALVNIGADVESIGKSAFTGCGMKAPNKTLVYNIASEHAPSLPDYSTSFGATSITRIINFSSETAYTEATNKTVTGWDKVDAALQINHTPTATQAAAMMAYDLYFEFKQAA